MGDSLSRTHFLNTVYFLAAPMLRQYPAAQHAVASCHSVTRNEALGLVRECVSMPCLLDELTANLDNDMELICYIMHSRTGNRIPSIAGHSLAQVLKAGWLLASDVLVMNFGLHFGDRPAREYESQIRKFVKEVVRWSLRLKNKQRKFPMIIWRETSPQHFPSAHGLFHSLSSWKTNASVSSQCVPITIGDGKTDGVDLHEKARQSSSDATHDFYNNIARPLVIAEKALIHLLPTWATSTQRWDEHFGWNQYGTLDCTHYCLPSGTMSFWTSMLVGLLLGNRLYNDVVNFSSHCLERGGV